MLGAGDSYSVNNPNPDLQWTDEQLVNSMQTRIDQHFLIDSTWREIEVRESYAMYEGDQWTVDDINRQKANAMPIITVNRAKPVINSIVGFEIQNRLDVKYVPRLNNEEQNGFKDVVENAVKYIEQTCSAPEALSYAFQDALICGVGATDTLYTYDRPPHNGDFHVERVFPAFLFWDPSSRGKNILDSDYVIRMRITNKDSIKDQYDIDIYDTVYSNIFDARVLEFFNAVLANKQLAIIYEYQWRKRVPIYTVDNPFRELNVFELVSAKGLIEPDEIMMFTQIIEGFKQYYSEKYNFVADQDQIFVISNQAEFRQFKSDMSSIGIKVSPAEQWKNEYYRALIIGSKVVSKSLNYSQTGFSIKFITGEFSEITQYYFGLMRAIKPPQRMLNQAMSDYQGFLNTIPKGGVILEEHAVSDADAFVATYARAKQVTFVADGALAEGRVMPKVTPPIPQGLLEMIQYADSQIMQVCGVTPEMMGTMNTAEQNASFLRQQIRQGLSSLATYFDARRLYLHEQGMLYIDCVRVLCENSEGRLIRNVIGEDAGKFVPLLIDNVASDYDIIIDEQPSSPDEKQNTFEKLLPLVDKLPQLMPLLLEFAPFDDEVTKKIKKLMEPQPPQEPDPLSIATIESEIAYKQASAEKLKADAYKTVVDAQYREMEIRIKEIEAHYKKDNESADITLKDAKTISEIAKAHRLNGEADAKRLESKYNH